MPDSVRARAAAGRRADRTHAADRDAAAAVRAADRIRRLCRVVDVAARARRLPGARRPPADASTRIEVRARAARDAAADDQPPGAAAGAGQPPRQRDPGDARRRHADTGEPRSRRWRGLAIDVADTGPGFDAGRRGHAVPAVRHQQARRHRAWAVDQPQPRRALWRRHHRAQRAKAAGRCSRCGCSTRRLRARERCTHLQPFEAPMPVPLFVPV